MESPNGEPKFNGNQWRRVTKSLRVTKKPKLKNKFEIAECFYATCTPAVFIRQPGPKLNSILKGQFGFFKLRLYKVQ